MDFLTELIVYLVNSITKLIDVVVIGGLAVVVWIGGALIVGDYFRKRGSTLFCEIVSIVWFCAPFLIMGIIWASHEGIVEPLSYVAGLVYIGGILFVGHYLDNKGLANKHWIYLIGYGLPSIIVLAIRILE